MGVCAHHAGRKKDDRQAVARLMTLKYKELGVRETPVIGHSPAGQPYLVGSDRQISISHDMGCPAVATAASPIGIDLQHLCQVPPSFQRRLQQRTTGAATSTTPSQAIQSWVARESIAKCRGLGLRDKPWDYRLSAGPAGRYEECYWVTVFLHQHSAWLGVSSLYGPIKLILNGECIAY